MKREIRDKRNELLNRSSGLRTAPFDKKCKDTDRVREEQRKIYKKWNFYDKLIKASERVEKNV